MKTYRFLKSKNVSIEKVAKRFANKPSVYLLSAIHNPDYSTVAVQALKTILINQGITVDQIELFQWDSDELYVPSFGRRPSPEKALY